MDFYQVTGGTKFEGKVRCSGAKNFSTKAIIASLLSDEISILENVPNIGDVNVIEELIKATGSEFQLHDGKATITPNLKNAVIEYKSNINYGRLTILLLVTLIHKHKNVVVPKMQGCKFGPRAVDFFYNILHTFGITIEDRGNEYHAHRQDKIQGQRICLKFPSVGATEFAILMAVKAEGLSVIENIALEPEITSLISMLQHMGAKIQWNSHNKLMIEGTNHLSGATHRIFNDRIEAVSWAVLAACSDGEIEVENVDLLNIAPFLGIYQRMGGGFQTLNDGESVKFFRKSPLKSLVVESGPYPSISTDYQPMITLMMTQAEGISAMHETLFEDRLGHLNNLNKFNAKTELVKDCIGHPCRFVDKNHYHSAFICGKTHLKAPNEMIKSENLRSGITYILAGCIAEGTSKIGNIEHVLRGYENLLEKLRSVNVDINLIRGESK